jgi:fucose 4-O-acetylase-like acetyltransferase
VDDLTGSLIRLGLLAAGALLVAAFLAVTPSHRMWFSGLGASTMYAYLLHGFVVKVTERFHDALDSPRGIASMILFGAALATLLCTGPVRRAAKWAVEPDVSWAFTRLRRPAERKSMQEDSSPSISSFVGNYESGIRPGDVSREM